jgi:hypothetical protein
MISFLIGALAIVGDPAPSAETLAARPKKEVKICRTQEITGTRMGGRSVCKTADEWRLEKEDAERMLAGRRDLVDGHPVSMTVSPLPQ